MSSSIVTAVARTMSCIVLFASCLPAPTRFMPARAAINLRHSKRVPQRINSSASVEVARIIGKIAFASDRDGNFEIYSMDTAFVS